MRAFDLIYVVEDDAITSTITALTLRQHRAYGAVLQYANGRLAVEALRQGAGQEMATPDLILLDLNMPVMDGWEFLDAFAALDLPKHVHVCVLTSSIHPDDIEKAKRYEAVEGYFSKPLNGEILNQIVHLLD